MKTLITITMLAIASLSCAQNKNSKDLWVINDQEVKIEFTTKYTFDDLVEVRDQLKKADITLKYSNLMFDKDGQLKKISASIEYSDGKSASFESKELHPGDGPGFRRKF